MPNAPKENTQLESHLYDLRGLQEQLQNAVKRATDIADRLLGGEPTPMPGTATKDAAEPPLLQRINNAHQIAKDLTEQVHYQLQRLERL